MGVRISFSISRERRPHIEDSIAQRFREVFPRFPLPGGHEIFPERFCSGIGDFTLLVDSTFSSLPVEEEEIFRRLRLEGTRCAPGELFFVIINETVRELEHYFPKLV